MERLCATAVRLLYVLIGVLSLKVLFLVLLLTKVI